MPAFPNIQNTGYWFREVGVPKDAAPPPEPDPAADGELHLTPVQIEVDAKLYEIVYPGRVRRIVAAGGLPSDLDFGPPEAKMVAALLRRAGHTQRAQSHEVG
jgi:hypothetical protein